jgi:hypothetical protein
MKEKPTISEKISQGISRFLQKRHLKHAVDEDGDFPLIFAFDHLPGRAHIVLMRQGTLGELLTVMIRFEEIPPLPNEAEALQIANNWNAQRRWPRIYWQNNHFFGDFHLDLEPGFSQRLLEQTLHHLFMGTAQFLLHITHQEKDFLEEIKKQLPGFFSLN